jgi:TetR/AcrR family transcriptional regulator
MYALLQCEKPLRSVRWCETGWDYAPPMSMTPWGESSELRLRRLPPGRGTPREEVEQSQRERLYGATVAVVANRGYADTTVTDLIEVAGVSRETFYKFFDDKEACFLATLEEILTISTAVTASRIRGDEGGGRDAQAERGLAKFVELLVMQPDAARIAMVESYAAGQAAQEMVSRTVGQLEDLAMFVFAQSPETADMPREMITGMIGSIRKIIHTRLHRRAEGELIDLVPDLVSLAMLFRPPPGKMRQRRRHLKPRDSPLAPLMGDTGDRIEAATLAVVAEHGWTEATIGRIASAAGVALGTFYVNFDDKSAAFAAAIYRRRMQLGAEVLSYYHRARSWPEAIRDVVTASLIYFESESDFAQVAMVDVYSAGVEALEARDRVIEEGDHFILDGDRYAPLGNPVAAEAILSGLYSMVAERVRKSGTKNLRSMAPLATYCVLVPFVGPEEAAMVASGEEPQRRTWSATEEK